MLTFQPASNMPSTSSTSSHPRRSSTPQKVHRPVGQLQSNSSPTKKRRLEENAIANRIQSRSSGQKAPPQSICAFCLYPAQNARDGPKLLISCFECGSSGHPCCLRWGRNSRKVKAVQSYEWRCIECKKCEICKVKGDDARLMFCDRCDRGWHLYCLSPPMDKPPRGQWACPTCHQLESHMLNISAADPQSLLVPANSPQAFPSGQRKNAPTFQATGSGGNNGSADPDLWHLNPSLPSANRAISTLRLKGPRHHGESPAVPTTIPTLNREKSDSSTVILNLKKSLLSAAGSLLTLSTGSPWSVTPANLARTPNKSQKNGTSNTNGASEGRVRPTNSSTIRSSRNGSEVGSTRKRKSTTQEGRHDGSEQSSGAEDRPRTPSRPRGKQEVDHGEASESEEEDPFDGVLKGTDANTAMYRPTSQDIERFEHGKRTAESKLGGSLASLPSSTIGRAGRHSSIAALSSSAATSPRTLSTPLDTPQGSRMPRSQLVPSSISPSTTPAPNASKPSEPTSAATSADTGSATPIKCVRFGEFDIDTWYQAPYPEEYSLVPDGRLWICEYCLKYMKSRFMAQRHRLKCKARTPPGDEIYRDGNICVYEVDGRKNKIYCQNLCLLAKMFLDHKTLYYDVEPFLFYIVTEGDSLGDHFVGYFSKEKRSPLNYNVSCIMTLPVRQRRGWGNFLIDISFLLSKKENRIGSPEKPLSDLGLLSYRNYWTLAVFYYLRNASEGTTMEDISRATAMPLEDIFYVLREQDMIVVHDHGPSRTPATSKYRARDGEQPIQPRGRGRPRLNAPANPLELLAYKDRDKPAVAKLPTNYHIYFDRDYIVAHLRNYEAKGYLKVRAEKLKWTPFLVSRSVPQQERSQIEPALSDDQATPRAADSRARSPPGITANLGFSVLDEIYVPQARADQSHNNAREDKPSREDASIDDHSDEDAPSSPSVPNYLNGARARRRARALLADEDEDDDEPDEAAAEKMLFLKPIEEDSDSSSYIEPATNMYADYVTDEDAEGSSEVEIDADGSDEDAPGSDDDLS